MANLLGDIIISDYYYATIGDNDFYYPVNGVFRTVSVVNGRYNDRNVSATVPANMNAYLAYFSGTVHLQLISLVPQSLRFKYSNNNEDAFIISVTSTLSTNAIQSSKIKKYSSKPMTLSEYNSPLSVTTVSNTAQTPTILQRIFGGTVYIASDYNRAFTGDYIYRPDYYVPQTTQISNSSWLSYLLLGGFNAYVDKYPITYIPINSVLSGPESAASGETVNVSVSFPSGYIYQEMGVSIYNKDGAIPFTYADGTLSFTMP